MSIFLHLSFPLLFSVKTLSLVLLFPHLRVPLLSCAASRELRRHTKLWTALFFLLFLFSLLHQVTEKAVMYLSLSL